MSTKSVRSWMPPIPRPLERLFNSVPLLTYDANELPARAQSSTASDIPTLYVFSTEEDARKGLPSFNPKCLKWQTFLKLSKIPFNIIPSTNHASPTSQLPFLLPARKPSPTASKPPGGIEPIPSSKLEDWVLSQKQKDQASPEKQDEKFHPRQEAYQSLLDVPLRNSWLYTLYLDPTNSNLVEKLYIHPSSSSLWIRATLRHQLRRAAESAILTTTHSVSSGGPLKGFAHGVVHPDEIYRSAKEALEALAYELSIDNRGAEGNTGWFFGATEPGLFDAEVFAYVYLMVRFFSRPESAEGEKESGEEETKLWLGDLVRQAGNGELVGHMNRILELTWPDLVVRDA
ncbi:hypothetical protein QBC37DRAFT_152484 [Rhypophila decipiens]|uniref:Thioredoxin-like fold domain-containing protein n=1 Tax=Rhypophila decipiens TaxID=261697 RepID=A0AAN7BDB8_9PEZI|nr:hypothetical protein QBC37DRAFT_152484 [Rhypophila decipiens]